MAGETKVGPEAQEAAQEAAQSCSSFIIAPASTCYVALDPKGLPELAARIADGAARMVAKALNKLGQIENTLERDLSALERELVERPSIAAPQQTPPNKATKYTVIE